MNICEIYHDLYVLFICFWITNEYYVLYIVFICFWINLVTDFLWFSRRNYMQFINANRVSVLCYCRSWPCVLMRCSCGSFLYLERFSVDSCECLNPGWKGGSIPPRFFSTEMKFISLDIPLFISWSIVIIMWYLALPVAFCITVSSPCCLVPLDLSGQGS
jgi:hypothetical protein